MTNINPIICPIRNGLSLTLSAHRTFMAQDIPIEILYINNASTDGTTEWLNKMDTFAIHHTTPKSVAASWNEGLDYWFSQGAAHCLVVNNDVLLRPDTYRCLRLNGGGFVTAVGNDDPECVRNLTPPMVPPRGNPDFSCFLIRREVWDKVGPFDEQFAGAFCEDWDYHCRMHKAGIKAICIDIPFYHVGSGSVKLLRAEDMQRVQAQAARNREYFREKWGFEGASDAYYAFFAEAP